MASQKTVRATKRLAQEPPRSLAWARAAIWLSCASLVVFLPGGMVRWFLPKDALFAFAVLAAVVAIGRGRLPRWFLASMAATVLLLVLGALFSTSPWAALWGRWPRYEGLISLPVYAAAAFTGARLLGPGSGTERKASWWTAISAASIALGAISVLESLGLAPIPSSLDRPGALLGNATDQGMIGVAFFAILLPPAAQRWARPRGAQTTGRPWLLSAGVTAALATAVLSASRAAFLALGVAILTLGAFALVRAHRQRRDAGRSGSTTRIARGALISAAGVLALAGLALLLPLTRERLLGSDPLSSRTIDDRLMIWRESLNLLATDPLTGTGPSGFLDAIPRFHDARWYEVVGSDTVLDSPHDVLLQGAFAGGVLLVLVLLAAGILTVLAGIRGWLRSVADELTAAPARPGPSNSPSGAAGAAAERSALLAGAVAALLAIAAALLTTFTAPATAILGCLLAGMLVAGPVPSPLPPTRRTPARTVLLSVTALWAAALTITAVAEIPLDRAVTAAARGDIPGAQFAFQAAHLLRPWDADVCSIAAEALAQQAVDGRVDAAPLAREWAERALAVTPDSLSALKALAAAQDALGDTRAERLTLDRMLRLAPDDPDVAELRSQIAAD